MSTLNEGVRISNYLLESRVGAGSFGEVWRARHHMFGNVVAIKIPTDSRFVRNLQREGVAVHGLRHPNIVRAIDLDPYAEPPYFIMEYVEGPSLRAAIDEYRGEFPIGAAASIMRGVLGALGAAHEAGLIHRDIKPANILLNHPLEGLASIADHGVRVTDFGLGRIGGETTQSLMQSGSLLTDEGRSIAGTLAYMSPEQKEGKELDVRSDLYSCGIVLYEMLTGERPQGTDLPSSLRPAVPATLDQVFRRSYTRLNRRYATAGEMLAALAYGDRGAAAGGARFAGAEATGRRACPQCSFGVQSDDQFCIRCGHQLAASVPRCGKCQAFVHGDDRFCILCGNDLRVLTGWPREGGAHAC